MRILLVGGGTLGSVTPLLAVRDRIEAEAPGEHVFFFVGTPNGPESKLAKESGLEFRPLAAPKLDRFLAARLFGLPFLMVYAVIQAFLVISRFKPQVIVSAGSYVAVPFSYAARALRVPTVLHQMDIRPGLANRLMEGSAAATCLSVEGLRGAFRKGRTFVTGIPVRKEISEAFERRTEFAARAEARFKLDSAYPTLLVVGGGTGSLQINRLVEGSAEKLVLVANVIHVTGMRKGAADLDHPRYKAFEILSAEEMAEAIAVADLVVSRAGMGFMSEFLAMERPFVLVPLPDSHQEENAEYFRREAGVPVLGKDATPAEFLKAVSAYLSDPRSWPGSIEKLRRIMPPKAAARMADIVSAVGERKDLPRS